MNFPIPRLPYAEDKVFGWLFFIALVVPLIFSVITYESFEIVKFAFLLFGLGGVLLALFKRGELERPFGGSRITLWLLSLFWLFCLLSTLLAWDKNYALWGFYARFTNGLVFYSLWAILLILLGTLAKPKLEFLLKVLVVTAGLMALWALLQSVGFGFYLGPAVDYFSRAAPSFLGNPDFAAMYIAALLPLSIALASESQKYNRLYYLVSLALQVWALVILASRGGLLAAGAGLLTATLAAITFGRRANKVWLLWFLGVLAVSAVFYFGFLNVSRPNVGSVSAAKVDMNVQNRLGVWRLTWQAIQRRPVFGAGLGNFELIFERERPNSIVAAGFFDDAHNLPLMLAATAGLPAAVSFFGLWAVGAWACLRRLRAAPKALDIGLLAAIVAWLVASLFTPVPIACYVILAVLLAACLATPAPAIASALPRWLKYLAGVIGLGLLTYACLFFTAEILFFAGVKNYNGHNFSKAYAQTSWSVRLNPVNRWYYVYRTASAIRDGQSLALDTQLISATAKFNAGRGFSYIQQASLYYLLLYQTQDPKYEQPVLQNLQTAIALDPYSAANYFLLSQYQLIFKNLPAAQSADEQSLTIDGTNYEARILLAKIYQLEDKRTEFLAALSDAKPYAPDPLPLIKFIGLAQKASDIKTLPLDVNFNLGNLE